MEELFGRTEVPLQAKEAVATHYYNYFDNQVGLEIYDNRIALSLNENFVGPQPSWETTFRLTKSMEFVGIDSSRLALTSSVDEIPFAAMDQYYVYSSEATISKEFTDSLLARGLVSSVVPVFKTLDSDSEVVVTNQAKVRLAEGVDPNVYFADERFASFEASIGDDQYRVILASGHGIDALNVINAMHDDAEIVWAEPNFIQRITFNSLEESPRWENLWHLENTGQVTEHGTPGIEGVDVNITEAWGIAEANVPGYAPGWNSSTKIGIADTGFQLNHEDLLFHEMDAGWGTGGDTNGNGWAGDRYGWNFKLAGTAGGVGLAAPGTSVGRNAFTLPRSQHDKHGTAVAGLAAAISGNGGVVGTGAGSPIIPAVIGDQVDNGAIDVATAEGLEYAIYYLSGRHRTNTSLTWDSATVVNHSWSIAAPSAAITTAFEWAATDARDGQGVPQIISVGNTGEAVLYPAYLTASIPGVIAVGAMDNRGSVPGYASFDNNTNREGFYTADDFLVDVAAPTGGDIDGGSVLTLRLDTTDLYKDPEYIYNNYLFDGYNTTDRYTGTDENQGFGGSMGEAQWQPTTSGTSASAAIVTGIAAYAYAYADAIGESFTASEFRSLLRNTTNLRGNSGVGSAYNFGSASGYSQSIGFGLVDAGALLRGIGTANLGIQLRGNRIAEADPIDFGDIFTGGPNFFTTFRLRNEGTETLEITDIAISGDTDNFAIDTLDDSSLSIGESTSLNLSFIPTDPTGVRTATISITWLDENDDPQVSTFDVSFNSVYVDVSGWAYEDRNGNLDFESGENRIQNLVLLADTNNNGIADTTNPNAAEGGRVLDPPLVLNAGYQWTIPFDVDGSAIPAGHGITDVDLRVNITHQAVENVRIILISPAGGGIFVYGGQGTGQNLTDTVFDDSGEPFESGSAPYTGTFALPSGSMSYFNDLGSEYFTGTWQLIVQNPGTGGAQQGFINDFTLTIGTGEERTFRTSSLGFYGGELGPGTYTVAPMATPYFANPWLSVPGAPASYTVTIPPNGAGFGSDFPLAMPNRFYAHVFDDVNGNGIFDGADAPREGRLVYIDADNDGQFNGPPFAAPSLPIDGAGNPGGSTVAEIFSEIEVTDFVGLLNDVNLTINIDHTYVSDLRIRLIGPDDTSVLLVNGRGGSGDNFTATTFDDEAASSITEGSAPFTGSFRPEELLSGFDGTSPNGTWKLGIVDTWGGADFGVLKNWSLAFNNNVYTDPPGFNTGADGWVSFDLGAGTYNIRVNEADDWFFTVPGDGHREVTVAAGTPPTTLLVNQTFGEWVGAPTTSIGDISVYHNGYTGANKVDELKSLVLETTTPTTMTFDNLINSAHGINGVQIEFEGLGGPLSPSDFVVQVSPTGGTWTTTTDPPALWDLGPAPTVSTDGDTALLTWTNNAIENRYLRLTVLSSGTGISEDAVYYVGHLLGEMGNVQSGAWIVSAVDYGAIRSHIGVDDATAGNLYDVNKNGTVANQDIALARAGSGISLAVITVQAAGGSELLLAPNGRKSDGAARTGNFGDFDPVVPVRDNSASQVLSSSISGSELSALASQSLVDVNTIVTVKSTSLVSSRDSLFGEIGSSADRASDTLATASKDLDIQAVETVFEQVSLRDELISRV